MGRARGCRLVADPGSGFPADPGSGFPGSVYPRSGFPAGGLCPRGGGGLGPAEAPSHCSGEVMLGSLESDRRDWFD